ncbi:hypothetical protein WDW86_05275 [Bdellovibrionota bacterium FG-2]
MKLLLTVLVLSGVFSTASYAATRNTEYKCPPTITYDVTWKAPRGWVSNGQVASHTYPDFVLEFTATGAGGCDYYISKMPGKTNSEMHYYVRPAAKTCGPKAGTTDTIVCN